jgi:hypothetical protein
MLLKTLSNIIFHLYRQSELLENKIVGEYMFCLLDTRAVIEILQITVDVSWLFNLKRLPFYNVRLRDGVQTDSRK